MDPSDSTRNFSLIVYIIIMYLNARYNYSVLLCHFDMYSDEPRLSLLSHNHTIAFDLKMIKIALLRAERASKRAIHKLCNLGGGSGSNSVTFY